MIGLTNQKNSLTFGGDPIPDTDSGSLFHCPHHCGIEDADAVAGLLQYCLVYAEWLCGRLDFLTVLNFHPF